MAIRPVGHHCTKRGRARRTVRCVAALVLCLYIKIVFGLIYSRHFSLDSILSWMLILECLVMSSKSTMCRIWIYYCNFIREPIRHLDLPRNGSSPFHGSICEWGPHVVYISHSRPSRTGAYCVTPTGSQWIRCELEARTPGVHREWQAWRTTAFQW